MRRLTSRRRLDALVALLAAVSFVAWLSRTATPETPPLAGDLQAWSTALVSVSLIVYFGILRQLVQVPRGRRDRRPRTSTGKTGGR